MKKFYVLFSILTALNLSINAQLKMDSGGNIAIAATPTPNNYTKLHILQSTTNHTSWTNFAVVVVNEPTNNRYNQGLHAYTYFSSAQSNSRNYGLIGRAGNASNGFNYGVYGALIGSNNGAGVFGAMSGRYDRDTEGNWAGYFNGDVKITDTITANRVKYNTLVETSDQRLKKDISPLSSNTLTKISQLNAVEFRYKSYQELINDGIVNIGVQDTINPFPVNMNTDNRIQYGFIAQDLLQIFPELVYMGQDSVYGVDYISLIPIIVEILKEQNDKITDLETQLNNCCKTSLNEQQLRLGTNESTNTSENSEISGQAARLFQNTPNPFTRETQIKCYIPVDTRNAHIYIYNMQGTQLKKHILNGTGEIILNINAYELTAGMYLYALIVDGIEIDVKRMVITD
ncbi:MAG: tail fiber domain-containing protein [Bacteroidales bacterium]|nr:tail fiber domain-containing protein [Bacteroidales bacterium]